MGRAALSMLDLPWPAILWDQGLKSDELVLVHHMPEGVGKDSLLDVLDGISAFEQGHESSNWQKSPICVLVIPENGSNPSY